MKKYLILVIFTGITVSTLFMSNAPINQNNYEQTPPIPLHYFIQKLQNPKPNEANLIMEIEYLPENLPQYITLYNITNEPILIKDDGTYPDKIAHDNKYTFLLYEDINKLETTMFNLQEEIDKTGYVMSFEGHDGNITASNELQKFDIMAFKAYKYTEIFPHILAGFQCTDIKKEKSLLITDLNVVEDPARTYNLSTLTGNPTGVWTFGEMFKNMVDPTGSNSGKVRQSLKNILYSFIQEAACNPNIPQNAIVAKDRPNIINQVIYPWIELAMGVSNHTSDPGILTGNANLFNWETSFDNLSEAALLQYAPFKLTAIVNRLDLRGNDAYSTAITNAGETRFIFTLVNSFDYTVLPTHVNFQSAAFGFQTSVADWKGMNVIFEYGNPQNNISDLINFGNQWANLSDASLPLGTPAYNAALQAITDQVTGPNVATNKPNGSAINRIRSHEKICDNLFPNLNLDHAWGAMEWGFRQFELNSNGDFEMVPLTNTTKAETNFALFSGFNLTSGSVILTGSSPVACTSALPFDAASLNNILTWINTGNNKSRVLANNYNLPANLLSNGIEQEGGLLHYFGFDPAEMQNIGFSDYEAKKIRHNISLNTCASCHGGETKTAFSMIRPLPYGIAADYTGTTPAGIIEDMDGRGYPIGLNANNGNHFRGNGGFTFEQYLMSTSPQNAVSENSNLEQSTFVTISSGIAPPPQPFNSFYQYVSPFLTGRRYTKDANNNYSWQDDNTDPNKMDNIYNPLFPNNNALYDSKLTGLFYVNDPDNASYPGAQTNADGPYPHLHDTKYGYNDLEMRYKSLCRLLNGKDLEGLVVLNTIKFIQESPFPVGAH